MESIKEFLTVGSSSGSGSGYGYGSGYGSSDGDGDGDGDGYGSGSGSGYGSGDGYGSGSGSGDGSGSGSGYGYGSGDGSGLKEYCGNHVYYIDNTPTVITNLKGFIAKGFTINNDLTTTQCYVVRVGNSFAHGSTIKQAQKDAENKHMLSSPIEERIDLFLSTFKESKNIYAKDLYDWHFNLTGSCGFGRDEFIRNKGINIEKDKFTIPEFISLTKNEYRGDVIKELEKAYNERLN